MHLGNQSYYINSSLDPIILSFVVIQILYIYKKKKTSVPFEWEKMHLKKIC